MRRYLFWSMVMLISACGSEKKPPVPTVEDVNEEQEDTMEIVEFDSIAIQEPLPPPVIGELEQRLIDSGLVDIQDVDPSIIVDLKYSTTDNFFHTDAYGDLTNAYMQPEVAERLAKCQQWLKEQDSTLSLYVFDAVRPRFVQQIMWDSVDMPINEKVKFISNPKNGSIHNYGAAIDVTIAKNGEPLDMGAGFDDPRPEAWPSKEEEMLAEGRITEQHIENRELLRRTMRQGGFWNIQSEWWHFNAMSRAEAKKRYSPVE